MFSSGFSCRCCDFMKCPNCHVKCREIERNEQYFKEKCPKCEFTYTEELDEEQEKFDKRSWEDYQEVEKNEIENIRA